MAGFADKSRALPDEAFGARRVTGKCARAPISPMRPSTPSSRSAARSRILASRLHQAVDLGRVADPDHARSESIGQRHRGDEPPWRCSSIETPRCGVAWVKLVAIAACPSCCTAAGNARLRGKSSCGRRRRPRAARKFASPVLPLNRARSGTSAMRSTFDGWSRGEGGGSLRVQHFDQRGVGDVVAEGLKPELVAPRTRRRAREAGCPTHR